MAKSAKVAKSVTKSTNNNKSTNNKSKVTVLHTDQTPQAEPNYVSEIDGPPAALTDPGVNAVYLFSKKAELQIDQLTAEQVGAEYKQQVQARITDGSTHPFMKATYEKIGELVLSIPGNGNAATIKRLEAVFNMTDEVDAEDRDVFDTPLASKFATNPTSKVVYELGQQIDDETLEHMVTIVEGRKIFEGGFAVLNKDWERQFCTFDADGNLTNDPALRLPRAGSGTKRNPKRGNEETDYYKIDRKDGTGNERGSLIDDFVIGTKAGAPFNVWKEIKRRAASDFWRVNDADKTAIRQIITDPKVQAFVDAALESNDKEAWATLDRSQNRDRNTLVSRWRQCIGYRQQREAINQLPQCEVMMLGEDDGASARLTTPIQITYVRPGSKHAIPTKGLTIGQFLKINVPAAKQAADLEAATTKKTVPVSSGHLLATLKAPPKEPEVKETPVKGKINNYKEFVAGADSISAYAQEKGTFVELQNVLNKGDDESKMLATSLAPLCDFLNRLDPFFRVTAELVATERSKQREKANAEKLKAQIEGDNAKLAQLNKQEAIKKTG